MAAESPREGRTVMTAWRSAVLSMLILLAASVLAACGEEPKTPVVVSNPSDAVPTGQATAATGDAVLSGSITYTQRIALPRDATVVVGLYDLSRGATAAPLSELRFPAGGQVPIRFELPYESGRVQAGQSYGVRAQILVDGALWFSNDPPVPVLTRGAPAAVQIVVRPAVRSG